MIRTLLVLGALQAVFTGVQTTEFGRFDGSVQTEWLGDGRRMRLLADFRFYQPDSTEWLAPKDSIVDGASIPRVFWTFIGGPYEGKYRNASVVHDVACVVRTRPWKTVHRMFYLASRAGGVSALNAKVMYGAVYHFGPRWPAPTLPHRGSLSLPFSLSAQDSLIRSLTTDEDFLRMREYIRRNPTIELEAIERLTRAALERAVPQVPPAFRGLLQEL